MRNKTKKSTETFRETKARLEDELSNTKRTHENQSATTVFLVKKVQSAAEFR